MGAGEGTLSLLLAQTSRTRNRRGQLGEDGGVLAEKLVKRNGIENVEYRHGDIEELPIADEEVDIALLHQSLHHALHPQKAVEEAWRILRPGGRIVILDLLQHSFEQARELYADVWLGFSQVDLSQMLANAHFSSADIAVVRREEEAPHFETVMAVATKRHSRSKD